MSIRIQAILFDCQDIGRVATFWQEALGWRRTLDAAHEIVLEPPAGSPEDGVSPDLLFLPSSAGKTGKNRLHLDLRPQDQAMEVARLIELGASRAAVGQGDDVSWVVMADPEGNEFCVLRPYRPDDVEVA